MCRLQLLERFPKKKVPQPKNDPKSAQKLTLKCLGVIVQK